MNRLGARGRSRAASRFATVRVPDPVALALRWWANEPRLVDRARLVAAVIVLRCRGRASRPVRLSVTSAGGRVRFRAWGWVDLNVAREILLDREYRLPAGLTPGTILDLGANIGIATLYFRVLHPRCEVLAVEPDPAQLPRLRANVGDDPRVRVVPAAVTLTAGPTPFFSAREGWVSSLYRPPTEAIELTVPGRPLEDLLQEANLTRVDVVKLDIEGAEWPLLEAGHVQRVTDCIVGELHHGGPNQTLDRARSLLTGWRLTVHTRAADRSTFTAWRPPCPADGSSPVLPPSTGGLAAEGADG